MILLLLLLMSMFVWLGVGLFTIRLQWYDLVSSTVLRLNSVDYTLPIPGMGIVLFMFVGVALLGVMLLILQFIARQAITRLHQKERDVRLPIQFYRPIWVDAMNEHTESVASWLAPLLAWFVVVVFVVKYMVGVILIAIAKLLPHLSFLFDGFGWTLSNQSINQINAVAVQFLAFAVDINGMVTFGFGVIVLVALYLYRFERNFIRDYAVMQHQK